MTTVPPNWFGFLSDEERVPHSAATAVASAADQLRQARPDTPEPYFVAANQTSLVLFRLGRVAEARALCAAEIRYAYTDPAPALRARLAALGLQPQLNLLRIEGYGGNPDVALAGLAALERVADGHPVATPHLRCDPADFAADPALGTRIRGLARNVRIADTCKLLLRHSRTAQLLAEAERLNRRWPRLPGAGLQHAAEAPWAAQPGAQPVPETAALDGGDLQARRLAYVRTLHAAAHEAAHGDPARGGELARRLTARPAIAVEGRWASRLTVPRWRAVLGAVLRAAGEEAEGRRLLLDALETGGRLGDTALASGVRRHLGLPVPAVPGDDELTDRLAELTGRLTDVLAGAPARGPVTAEV